MMDEGPIVFTIRRACALRDYVKIRKLVMNSRELRAKVTLRVRIKLKMRGKKSGGGWEWDGD